MSESKKIVVLAGDGIGPEIVGATRRVLDAVGDFEYTDHLIGGASIDEHGVALTDEVIEACKGSDAVKARAKSIDLALIETKEPLPSSFAPVAIGEAANDIGAAFDVAGFGVAKPDGASTSGVLRRARLSLRAPLSHVLLWLAGDDGAGACTGDSGAPVFANGALVGIVAFAQGQKGRGCGGLTQAVRVAPYRAWIEQTIAGWR